MPKRNFQARKANNTIVDGKGPKLTRTSSVVWLQSVSVAIFCFTMVLASQEPIRSRSRSPPPAQYSLYRRSGTLPLSERTWPITGPRVEAAQARALEAGSRYVVKMLPELDATMMDLFLERERSDSCYLVWTLQNPVNSAERAAFLSSELHPCLASGLWQNYKRRNPHIKWTSYDCYSYLSTHDSAHVIGIGDDPRMFLALDVLASASESDVVIELLFAIERMTSAARDEQDAVDNSQELVEARTPSRCETKLWEARSEAEGSVASNVLATQVLCRFGLST